jgi:hypothetical protein
MIYTRRPLGLAATVLLLALLTIGLLVTSTTRADDKKAASDNGAIDKGQRVFTCGHSFHVFVPRILADMANKAGIKDHKIVGLSSIGGSRVIQHWNVPDEMEFPRKSG